MLPGSPLRRGVGLLLALGLSGLPAAAAAGEPLLPRAAPPAAEAAAAPVALPAGPPQGDATSGPGILVIPPKRADGRFDLPAAALLITALRERFGDRVVSAEQFVRAMEAEKLSRAMLRTPQGVGKLCRAVGAERVVVLELDQGKLFAAILPGPEDEPVMEIPVTIGKKLDAARAAEVAQAIFDQGGARLCWPPPPPAPVVETVPSDVAEEERREALGRQAPEGEPYAVLAAGPGAGFRSFTVESSVPGSLDPLEHRAQPSLGVYGALFPLRLASSLQRTALADLALEVHYRRAFVSATAGETTCPVSDDDLSVGASYRHPLGEGPWLPRIGGGLALGFERTELDCELPVVSTSYRFVEPQLRVAQPLSPDSPQRLFLELAAGPRFLLSGPEADDPGFAFGGELWASARLTDWAFARAGAKLTSTTLSRTGLATVSDLRTFLGLELGAFLR